MRMWMVNPKYMCRKHLLGEHVELHMLVGSINKQKSITGFINKGLIEPGSIEIRHRQLVDEMLRRGYNHQSPLPAFTTKAKGFVNTRKSLSDLICRCDECLKLYIKRTANDIETVGEVK